MPSSCSSAIIKIGRQYSTIANFFCDCKIFQDWVMGGFGDLIIKYYQHIAFTRPNVNALKCPTYLVEIKFFLGKIL